MKNKEIFEEIEREHKKFIDEMLNLIKLQAAKPRETWKVVIDKFTEIEDGPDANFEGLSLFLNEITSNMDEINLNSDEIDFIFELSHQLLRVKKELAIRKKNTSQVASDKKDTKN